jgi:hypothetical protein
VNIQEIILKIKKKNRIMIVEMLVRWTEMSFKKSKSDDDEIRRIINGDDNSSFGGLQPEITHDYSPIVFNMEDVARFNRGSEPGYTTVRFYDGDAYTMKVSYKEFMSIYSEFKDGKFIHSHLPEDYKDPFGDEPDNIDEDDLEI